MVDVDNDMTMRGSREGEAWVGVFPEFCYSFNVNSKLDLKYWIAVSCFVVLPTSFETTHTIVFRIISIFVIQEIFVIFLEVFFFKGLFQGYKQSTIILSLT